MSNALSHVGDATAMSVAQRALDVSKGLEAGESGRYQETLALAYETLAQRLAESGDLAAALEMSQQSNEVFRRLADTQPGKFGPDFGRSLLHLMGHQRAAGRPREAIAAGREALASFERLADQYPLRFGREFIQALNNVAILYFRLSELAPALYLAGEAVTRSRALVERMPGRFDDLLAETLVTLHQCLMEDRRFGEAGAAIEESVEIHRRLAHNDPIGYEEKLLSALMKLTLVLLATGLTEEELTAHPAFLEAAALGRRIFRRDSDPNRMLKK